MADGESGKKKKKVRLAEELRANLARRKAQTRSRRAGEADGRDEGIEASATPKPSPPRQRGKPE